jgi:hypothetical protein
MIVYCFYIKPPLTPPTRGRIYYHNYFIKNLNKKILPYRRTQISFIKLYINDPHPQRLFMSVAVYDNYNTHRLFTQPIISITPPCLWIIYNISTNILICTFIANNMIMKRSLPPERGTSMFVDHF